ncbi:alpha-terpineol synthase, chloroplastic-like isoform X1 [Tasmannia lanceolata]|uniref:alpha-terpineol synthase, chloroplastic-like isoform X1 n=1 Tax=Tasmannia lanceolata TaxID=3420 RepID=UPI004063CA91
MANQVSCVPSTQTLKPTITTIARRSANYEESFADYDFIQSLKCDYTGEMYERRLEKLKEEVRLLLEKVDQSVVDRLKLIDTLQRLGVGYHFKKEIKEALRIISTDDSNTRLKDDLYATALRFRLLRQHGFEVSQDVLNGFKGDKGDFMASLCEDTKGMLSLYEASHLAYEGEILLDEAKAFTTVHLHDALKGKRIEQKLARQVHHALKLPLHWRLPKLESRWYIEEIYVEEEDSNPLLFELAKLDYNMVQGIYQTNVKATSRWWKNLGLGKQLSFARDRLIECFLWALGPLSEPEFGLSREVVTKAFQLITSIDDIYDLHGSLEELELFTDVVERWDVNVMEQLPHYMKLCFLALFNTINEIAYDTLKEQGWEITQYLKKLWADLCKAYLQEAKWYSNRYTPTLDEYIKNGVMSIAGPVVLGHAYFSMKSKIRKEAIECIENNKGIILWASMFARLWDDLATSTAEIERGDVPKSIQCYMHETGASEAVARQHILGIISDTWKKMNKDSISSSLFPEPFIKIVVDAGRICHHYYHESDGFGAPNSQTKEQIILLLVEPILVKK